MITHIAHMDQDQSTDRSGEYLVYGNAADATTFASGMSALGFYLKSYKYTNDPGF